MNQQRTYEYPRDMLEGAILRLKGAIAYSKGDPLLGNALAHVRGSLQQARAALDRLPPVLTQSSEEAKS